MSIESIDAALLSGMFLAGAANLEAHKEYINELNVFPVPDGDTGTNMTMTVLSAAGEVSSLENPSISDIAKAMSSGSLRGARGNSGVILSQLLRGFSKTIQQADTIDVKLCSEAFSKAVDTAYKAVMKPKEGTILTVARESAECVKELAYSEKDFVTLGQKLLKKANESLKKTPELLPVLKEAGVVDSGGQGLVMFLQGALDVLEGKEVDYSAITVESAAPKPVKISAETNAEITFGYCTEFIIVLDDPQSDDELDEFKTFLNGMGDSIVFVPDDEIIKIHVHTNEPGTVLQKALTKGSLSRIKIDNMREEHQEKLFQDSLKLAAEQKANEEAKKAAAARADNTDADAPSVENKSAETAPHKDYGFIAVCAGDGLTTIFNDLGADVVISGGQTMNPSTEDFIKALESINADTVFILPNNSNIILAANQAAGICEDKQAVVIPTKTVPQGISAMIDFVEDLSPEENEEHMLEGIGVVSTAQITYAVRDTTIEGVSVRENDIMAIGDTGLICAGEGIEGVIREMFESIVDEDSEMISIYYGADVEEENARRILEIAEDICPDCEIEMYNGGQPVYYYIISVE